MNIPIGDAMNRALDKPRPRRSTCKGYKLLGESGQGCHSGSRTLMTDEQVLECRALHEFNDWPPDELAERYGVSEQYMVKLLEYVVRSKLIPKRPAA